MSSLFWLTDAQMARLQPFFPESHGKPRVDDRRVLIGIIFINRNDLRRRDTKFGAQYGAAMDTAFIRSSARRFEGSMDDIEPSNRPIEVLLKLRWLERLNGFLAFTAEGGSATTAPADLDPRVITRMEPSDRARLIEMLGGYLAAEVEAQSDAALVSVN